MHYLLISDIVNVRYSQLKIYRYVCRRFASRILVWSDQESAYLCGSVVINKGLQWQAMIEQCCSLLIWFERFTLADTFISMHTKDTSLLSRDKSVSSRESLKDHRGNYRACILPYFVHVYYLSSTGRFCLRCRLAVIISINHIKHIRHTLRYWLQISIRTHFISCATNEFVRLCDSLWPSTARRCCSVSAMLPYSINRHHPGCIIILVSSYGSLALN